MRGITHDMLVRGLEINTLYFKVMDRIWIRHSTANSFNLPQKEGEEIIQFYTSSDEFHEIEDDWFTVIKHDYKTLFDRLSKLERRI